MTVTEDVVVEDTGVEDQPKKRGRKAGTKDRDFTKTNWMHEQIAAYVNEHSGLDPVSPNQIKAVLSLRTDWANSPERQAEREQRRAQREAEKQKYAGMTDEQIKATKAANREMRSAERLRQKAEDAMRRARELAEQAQGSGEDLAAVIAAASGDADDEPRKRRGLGRR